MKEAKLKKEVKSKRVKRNPGFVMAYALIAAAIAATLLAGLLVFISTAQRRSSSEISDHQALQIAESGIYFYKWYLAHELDGKNADQIHDFWHNGSPYGLNTPYEQEVTDLVNGEIVGVGKYRLTAELPAASSTIVYLTSVGWTYKHPEVMKSVKVRFRRPSWSEYAVLANDVMRFGSGTTISGPVHSNNGIRFDGAINNLVTSSVEEYIDPDTGQLRPGVWTSQSNPDDVFLAGTDYPTPIKDFNGITTDLAFMQQEAQSNGLFLPEGVVTRNFCGFFQCGAPGCCDKDFPIGYHIVLNPDDTVDVWEVERYNDTMYNIINETNHQTYPMPDNGLIYAEGNVWVEGQIDTMHLTIVAANLTTPEIDPNIYIENDILYTNKDGQDILGLVAENDITIGHHSESDLEIDAALLAQKGRVGRDYYHQTRQSITIFGAIATNQRYGFAYTDGSGYQERNIYYDNSLLYYPPPFFPTGTEYELDLWEDL